MLLAFEVTLSALTGTCVLGVFPCLKRLFKKTTIDDVTPEWVESFSVERYRPMLALLSSEDFHFLVSQPGFDPAIYRKLRRERLAIFDQYFSRLIADFKKLHATARYLVALSVEDRSDVAMRLIQLRWSFALAVLQVHLRLQFCRLGLGTVGAQLLIARLQQMNDQLGSLSAPIPA